MFSLLFACLEPVLHKGADLMALSHSIPSRPISETSSRLRLSPRATVPHVPGALENPHSTSSNLSAQALPQDFDPVDEATPRTAACLALQAAQLLLLFSRPTMFLYAAQARLYRVLHSSNW